MKGKNITRAGVFTAIFVAGFSSALVANKLEVHSTPSEVVAKIKSHGRPLAVWIGLKAPIDVETPAASPKLIDVQRDFIKRVSAAGEMTMSELPAGAHDAIFKELKLISAGTEDAIHERFSDVGIQRRITYDPANDEFPVNLLRLVASVVKHGGADDANSFEASIKALESRQLSMTCGSVTLLAQRILAQAGIRSRIITTLTLEEWNTYSNGHTLLEVFVPKKNAWVSVDLDTNKMFETRGGALASALDLADQGVGSMQLVPLTSTPVLDYSGFPKYQTTAEFMVYDLPRWYGKMLQVIALFDEQSQKYVFMTDDAAVAQRVKSYAGNYSVVGRDGFIQTFYPDLH